MTEAETAPAGFSQGRDSHLGDPPTGAVGIPTHKNPYRPGAGLDPVALVGRDAELDDWDAALQEVENGHRAQSVVIHGLGGLGKTVLLGELCRRAQDRHWMAVLVEANIGRPLRDSLARALYPVMRELGRQGGGAKLEKALGTFRVFSTKVDIAGAWSLPCDLVPEQGQGRSGQLAADLSELISDIAEAAHEQGRGLAILVDEAQDLTSDELEALCQICDHGVQLGWPFLVALAGLPSLPRLLSKTRSSAEDPFTYREATLLESGAARAALVRAAAAEGVWWDEDAVSYVVAQTGGHPYLLQEYGRATWDAARGVRLTFDDARVGVVSGQAHLDAAFYRSHWERATASQRAYLKAMACDGAGPSKSGDIAARLRKTLMTTGSFRNSLVKKGLIYAPVHGVVAFAVMGMADFIARQSLP